MMGAHFLAAKASTGADEVSGELKNDKKKVEF